MSGRENTTNNSENSERLERTHYPSHKRNRLPTLKEVLLRKTAPPVCLFNFYLYMRDRENASEYLDFYLDVLEHEILCKAYIKDLKKLGLDVNTEYPEYEKFRPGGSKPENDKSKTIISIGGGIKRYKDDSSHNLLVPGSGFRPDSPSRQSDLVTNVADSSSDGENIDKHRGSVRSNKTNITSGNLSYSNRERPLTRDDLRESIERIYFKYINEGSEKEIVLSKDIREKIIRAMEEEKGIKRDDPWIYYEAKKEIYDFMEIEQFPRFLKCRAFGNMSLTQTMMRLSIGLFSLFIGFTVVLSLIFLDIKPRTVRLWSFIPIFLGVKNLFSYLTKLSPLFVLLKISETTFFRFQCVMEPFIYGLHIKKGIRVFLQSLIVSIIVTGVFVAVPGHRL